MTAFLSFVKGKYLRSDVTISDFHYRIIVAEEIHSNDIIAIKKNQSISIIFTISYSVFCLFSLMNIVYSV